MSDALLLYFQITKGDLTMDKIEAGILDKLKKMFNKLFGVFEKLADIGLKAVDYMDGEDGEKIVKLEGPEGAVVYVATKEEENDKFTVRMYDDAGKKVKKEHVPATQMTETISDILKDNWKFDISETTKASKTLNVRLKKIVSKKETAVMCSCLCGTMAPTAINDALCVLAGDADFVSSLPETDTTYTVTECGDEYDVCVCEDPSQLKDEDAQYNCIYSMLSTLIAMKNRAQFIHWSYRGDGFNDIHSLTDNMRWRLDSHIDMLGELSIELTSKAPNLNSFCFGETDDCLGMCTKNEVLEDLYKLCKNLICTLEMYMCNYPKDVQLMFESWIRDWSKDADYFIKANLDK